MWLHPLSWIALAVIAAALVIGWTRRFLAFGALAFANVAIHVLSFFGPSRTMATEEGAFQVPVIVADLALWTDRLGEPGALVQWVGHMFLHSGFGHLFGNMLILLVIGYYLEDRAGPRRVIAAYLLTGLVAAATELVRQAGHDTMLLGASGADFGLIGVLAAAYPQDRLRIPVPVFIILFIPMRAWMAAVVFAVFQFVLLSIVPVYGATNVAYFAHLGGLGAGLVLGWTVLRHKDRQPARTTGSMASFATTGPARDAWQKAEATRDEPDVHDAWLQRFHDTARCPRCGSAPQRTRRGLRCPHCGFDGQTEPLRS